MIRDFRQIRGFLPILSHVVVVEDCPVGHSLLYQKSEPRGLFPTREALSRRIVKSAALEEAPLGPHALIELVRGLDYFLAFFLVDFFDFFAPAFFLAAFFFLATVRPPYKVLVQRGLLTLPNAARVRRSGHTSKQKPIPILGSRPVNRLSRIAVECEPIRE